MRNLFVQLLIARATTDPRVFLMTPDMGFSVLEPFRAAFPDRFLNAGIAEQNAVGVAAGLALAGRRVYLYSMVPFVTMRCFEQVRNDLAYMNLPVRLVGVGGGVAYGAAGPTHHAIEDIAVMRALPNMTVCCPGDPVEARALVRASFTRPGPMYIRLGKAGEPRLHPAGTRIALGRAVPVSAGRDAALITTGAMLETGQAVVARLARLGLRVALLSMPTVKPLDAAAIRRLCARRAPLVTLEEHSVLGGLGGAVAEVVAGIPGAPPLLRLGIPDAFCRSVGGQAYLRRGLGLDPANVAARIRRFLRAMG